VLHASPSFNNDRQPLSPQRRRSGQPPIGDRRWRGCRHGREGRVFGRRFQFCIERIQSVRRLFLQLYNSQAAPYQPRARVPEFVERLGSHGRAFSVAHPFEAIGRFTLREPFNYVLHASPSVNNHRQPLSPQMRRSGQPPTVSGERPPTDLHGAMWRGVERLSGFTERSAASPRQNVVVADPEVSDEVLHAVRRHAGAGDDWHRLGLMRLLGSP
jgi:hypothetical protein